MANVLIGIIGVILFIGLALSTVIYIGQQFALASASSSASALSQATSQVVEAANMANLQTGVPTAVGSDITPLLITPNYLRAMPVNPVVYGNNPMLMTSAGVFSSGYAQVAVMDIGSADLVCVRIGTQTGQLGQGATTPATGTSFPTFPSSGCMKATAGAGPGLTVGHDYAFSQI